MKLRDYQAAAVDSLFRYYESGNTGNPIIALPTGTGKSLVIGDFIRRAILEYPGTRVMKLTHVKELVSQNLDKLLTLWPTAPAGVYSSGLGRKEVGYSITFGGVASVVKCPVGAFGRIDLLIVDECHLVSPDEDAMYQKIIANLKEINPYLKVIGLSATPYRLGQGMLTEPGGIFTDICFDMTTMECFNWLLEEGYLAPLVPKATSTVLDVTGVGTSGGEYKQKQLQAAVDIDYVTDGAVQEMIACGHDRKHWLVFASGVDHTEHVAAALNSYDIKTTYVHSKMSSAQRDANIKDWINGDYQAMINNGILTTGIDFPALDLIGILRPTKSTALWCLSEETEVLTQSGFKKWNEINVGDKVIGYDQNTGRTVNTYVTGYVKRPLVDEEKLFRYSSRQFEFCLTSKHQVLYEQRIGGGKWAKRKDSLENINGSSANKRLPVAAVSNSSGLFGYSEEALILLGLYLSDGSFDQSNNTLIFYQSERYPKIVEKIEKLLNFFNFGYRVKIFTPCLENGNFKTLHKMRRYVISKTSRSLGKVGWAALFLLEDFNKELAEKFQLLDKKQFSCLLEGINDGDGSKYTASSIYWKPGTFDISTGRKLFADNLQRLAIINGYSCRVSSQLNSYDNLLYKIYIKERLTQAFKPEFLKEVPGNFVWCIENPTGNLITRYNGHVLVTGNCQMLGRGTRPYPGKDNCLVLDFANNITRLGPINDPVLPRPKGAGGAGSAPVKLCPHCNTWNHASVRICCSCAAEFPKEVKIKEYASQLELIAKSEPIRTEVFKVDKVVYNQHIKPGKPSSIRVSYFCGLRRFQEWVSFEHSIEANRMAKKWWKERDTVINEEPPDSTKEALERLGGLKLPTHLRVWLKPKYDKILDYDYTNTSFGEKP